MLLISKRTSEPSFRDTLQSPDRKKTIQELVSDIAGQLPPEQILLHPPTYLSKSRSAMVELRVGPAQCAELVRSTMLTLELFKRTSPDSYAALRTHLVEGAPLSDWHAMNAETYGLGKTSDSKKHAAARSAQLRAAFWEGVASVFTLRPRAAINLQPISRIARLEFSPDPQVRDIFLSAMTSEGELRNPERI